MTQYLSDMAAQAAAPTPPPPPPAPAAAPPAPSSGGRMAAGSIANVFADLNRGEAVTKGLRKVEKSEMTHKNPALRAGSVVPSTSGSASGMINAPLDGQSNVKQ
jgi:adenylyl cyclase-associated protein